MNDERRQRDHDQEKRVRGRAEDVLRDNARLREIEATAREIPGDICSECDDRGENNVVFADSKYFCEKEGCAVYKLKAALEK